MIKNSRLINKDKNRENNKDNNRLRNKDKNRQNKDNINNNKLIRLIMKCFCYKK